MQESKPRNLEIMEKDSREVRLCEARKKIDCLQTIENVTCSGNAESLRPGSKCDLRKSLAWDSAFFTSPGVLEPEELFAALNIHEENVKVDGQRPNRPLSSLPSETKKIRRANDCNARRSLAWDSEFFTNPGVLNAEELSLVNSGFSKTEVNKHPEIHGELSKSADLSSSLQSSRYSVTSIEIDLFEDLRASVCKSGTKCDAASSNLKHEGIREIQLSREPGACTVKRVITNFHSGRLKTNVQRQNRFQEEPLSSLTLQPKRGFYSGESSSLSHKKPPKVMSRFNTTPGASSLNKTLAPERAKPENSSPMIEIGRIKHHYFQEQPGSSPAHRSPYSSHALADRSTKSPTSWGKSRTTDSRLITSGSSFLTPSRCPNRRYELLSSSRPRCLLSKLSASSPASHSISTDGWSSDLAFFLNQRSFPGTASLDMTTLRAGLFDNGSSSRKASDSGAPQQHRKTPTKLTPPSDVAVTDVKPSGLRTPLPKIGFFDTGTSQKQNRELKFHSNADAANNGRIKKSQKSLAKETLSPLEQRNSSRLPTLQKKLSSDSGRGKCSKIEDKSVPGRSKSETGMKITGKTVHRSKRSLCPKEEDGLVHEENKENVLGFENRIDCLNKDIEARGLNRDVVIEIQTENLRLKY